MLHAYTNPSKACQLCDSPFNGVMFDAATRHGWGNLCSSCFTDNACSLGIGKGQKYVQASDGRYYPAAAKLHLIQETARLQAAILSLQNELRDLQRTSFPSIDSTDPLTAFIHTLTTSK